MNEVWAKLVVQAPGLVIALVMLFGAYRLLAKYGAAFIESQKVQATALGSQAASMTSLTSSLSSFVMRDNGEHQEMVILIKLMKGEMFGIREKLVELPVIKEKLSELPEINQRLETIEGLTSDLSDAINCKEKTR